MVRHGRALVAVAVSVAAAVSRAPAAQLYEENLPLDHPAIQYWETPLEDRISRLRDQLANDETSLVFTDGLGYLPSVLERLDVSTESQTLVFSKTSLQKSKISPRTPRAIYFSDDVAVGFVPGGEVIEMAAVDPRQGVVFYTLANREADGPRLERPKICLACHQEAATLGVPGLYVGSVFTKPSGRPSYRGSIVTDHRTPFEDRWGGWYVMNAGRGLPHRGNAVGAGPANDGLTPLLLAPEVSRYPAPDSDVVALMTLEHQTQLTNLIVRLAWEARIDPEAGQVASRIEELVRYMLFLDAAALPGPITGASAFAASFSRRGPRDERGRSLRDFDLKTRLFTYPLTYMVYSDAFAALPAPVRHRVRAELDRGLTAAIPAEQRRSVLEILRATKPALPGWWDEAP